MRLIATVLLLGVLCRLGLCNASGVDVSQQTTTTATKPPGDTTPASTSAVPAAASSTARQITQNPTTSAAPTASSAIPTEPNASTATTTPTATTVTPTATVIAGTTVVPGATTAAVTTTGPSPTIPDEATTTEQAGLGQPGLNAPQTSTVLPVSATSGTAATLTASTRTPTETSATGNALSSVPPTTASASTAHTTHSPSGRAEIPQTQHPSSATTTVAGPQDAPGPGGEATTTSSRMGISGKPNDATAKGDGDKMLVYVKGQLDEKGSHVPFKVCEELMKSLADTCTLVINPDGSIKEASVQVGPAALKELEKKHQQEEPPKNTTLIAILCSCGALLAMTAGFIAYTTCHRRSYRKNQQHLTEELQTVENCYHDNPTLEVMEVQPEMQEKKTPPNGEFNDSWIVPFDTLAKDDAPDEEDTHL